MTVPNCCFLSNFVSAKESASAKRQSCQIYLSAFVLGVIALFDPTASCGQGIGSTINGETARPVAGAGHDYYHLLAETIDPSVGSVNLRINLPNASGRGISFPVSAGYSSAGVFSLNSTGPGSLVWQQQHEFPYPGGWSYGLPLARISSYTAQLPITGASQPGGNVGAQTLSCTYVNNYTVALLGGENHSFGMGYTTATYNGTPTNSTNCPHAATQTTGSDARTLTTLNNPSSPSSPLLFTTTDQANGTTYRYTSGNSLNYPDSDGFAVLPDKIEDRNGNQITITTPSSTSGYPITVQDSAGHLVNITTDGNSTDTLSVGGLSYKVTWTTLNVSYQVQSVSAPPPSGSSCPSSAPAASGSVRVISSITLPNNQQYLFYYGASNPTDSSLANPYGLLNELVYPDGGWVKYTYKLSDTYAALGHFVPDTPPPPSTGNPNPVCPLYYSVPVLATRAVSFTGSSATLSQTYTYSTQFPDYNGSDWTSKTTSVSTTDSASSHTGNFAKLYTYAPYYLGTPLMSSSRFAAQLPLESSVATYDWGSSGKLLQTEVKGWFDQYRQACSLTQNDAGQIQGSFYNYGVGGLVSDKQEFDFGQLTSLSQCSSNATSAPSTLVPRRETKTTFSTFSVSPGATFAAPQSIGTYGDGNQLAETDYAYDEVALTPVSAINHDESAFGASTQSNRGNATTITRVCLRGCSVSPITKVTYDQTGQVSSVIDPCGNTSCASMTGTGHTTLYSYLDSFGSAGGAPTGQTNAYLTKVTSPSTGQANHVQTYTYRYADGQLDSSTDENGQKTSYGYNDPLLRLTSVTGPSTAAGQPLTQLSYLDTTGNPSMTSVVTASPDPSVTTTSVMDGMGRTTSKQLASAGIETDYTLDGTGATVSVSNPYGSNTSPVYTVFSYDSLGRVVSQTNPDGTTQSRAYQGAITHFYDEASNEVQRVSDGLGRMTGVTEVQPGSSASTSYGYDALNNLLSVNQAGASGEPRLRSFTYDSLSRLLWAHNPETGVVCYGAGDGTESGCQTNGYDGNGNLVTKTDARGFTTSYSYDTLNRLTHKTYSNGDRNQWFAYDGTDENGNSLGSPWTTNSIGRLSHTSDSVSIAASYAYDPIGRMQIKVDCVSGDCNAEFADYDLANNVTSLTYPDSRQLAIGYDSAGRLMSINGAGNAASTVYLQSATYHADGTPATMTYGNGVMETISQNSRLQTCESKVTNSTQTQTFLDRQYFFGTNNSSGQQCDPIAGNNGNIWNIVDAVDGTHTQSFSYDSLNRITAWNAPNMENGYRQLNFTYDSFGNMVSDRGYDPSVGSGPAVGTPSARAFPNPSYDTSQWPYNSYNQRVSATFDCTPASGSAPYDPAGNMLCDGSSSSWTAKQYIWDAESRISSVNAQPGSGTIYYPAAAYTYDAQGQRVRSDMYSPNNTSNTWREYSYFNGMMLAEKDQNGNWTDYIYANGKKIARAATTQSTSSPPPNPVTTTVTGLHTHGNAAAAGSGAAWLIDLGNIFTPDVNLANHVVQSGDQLVWRQYQSATVLGSVGGFWFSDCGGTGQLFDTNGVDLYGSSVHGTWESRTLSLEPYVGCHFQSVAVSAWTITSPGAWDLWVTDVALRHADGTSLPIYTPSYTPAVYFEGADSGETDLSAGLDTMTTNTSGTGTGAGTSGSSGTTLTYTVTDHLGTAALEFSDTGALTWEGSFAPFGQEFDANQTTNRFKFTGKERDRESGLDYFGARYYASSMGRWMSPDWAAKPEAVPYSDLANPQSLNLYGYVNNNPLSHVDADGHCDQNGHNCSVWDHAAGVIGGVLNVVPGAVNLGVRAFNAVSGAVGGPQVDELPMIQPDAHASGGGVMTGEAAQMLVPIGDLSEGAQLLRGATGGAEEGELIAGTERAAQREAMRQEGIPTSQQPASQEMTKAGRQYTYETPQGTKVVQRNTGVDRSHPGQVHVEAGTPKPSGQTDRIGRPRLQNDKTKVNVSPDGQ